MRGRLILFTRYPAPGRAKTRLIPLLGPDGAARLHRRLAEQAVQRARRLATPGCELVVSYTGATEDLMRSWLGEDLRYIDQGPGDLGARMLAAVQRAIADGQACAVIAGTDAPALGAAHFDRALAALDERDLVVGPATDGGYYLIGMRAAHEALFRDVPWGSGAVLAATLERARALQLRVALLDELTDVDRPDDLRQVRHLLLDQPAGGYSGPPPRAE